MASHFVFVIVIAGPTGVGKTTLSKMLSKYYNCAYISEDEITKEIFPDVYKNIEDYPDMVKIAESQLLKRTKEIFDSGECIVIDRINLGKEFIEEIKKAFHKHLILKVLWPPMETTIERDKRREGWTSGEISIKQFYKEYEGLKPIIGERNYIDNSHQTPEETLERFIADLAGMVKVVWS
jgi:cytidylate kinase